MQFANVRLNSDKYKGIGEAGSVAARQNLRLSTAGDLSGIIYLGRMSLYSGTRVFIMTQASKYATPQKQNTTK